MTVETTSPSSVWRPLTPPTPNLRLRPCGILRLSLSSHRHTNLRRTPAYHASNMHRAQVSMWLPVFLAQYPPLSPSSPPRWPPVPPSPPPLPLSPPPPPCLDNGMGGTTGRGDWPPPLLDPETVQCTDLATLWWGWRLCHASGALNRGPDCQCPTALLGRHGDRPV